MTSKTCQIIFNTICTGHWLPPYALRLLCGKWNARIEQKAYIYGCSFPMHVSSIFYNRVHQVLTHLIHTSHPSITHISLHSHSLGGKDESLSCLASTAKAGTNTKPRGEIEGTPLTSQVKLYLENVHSRKDGVCIDRSTRTLQRFTLPTRSPSSTVAPI
jgi:hypothetical protein